MTVLQADHGRQDCADFQSLKTYADSGVSRRIVSDFTSAVERSGPVLAEGQDGEHRTGDGGGTPAGRGREAGAGAAPWKVREQCFSRGRGSLRNALYQLQDGVRRFQPKERQRRCGLIPVPGSDVLIRKDGDLCHFRGLERCGSVWACPTCALAIKVTRAQEIEQLVAWHGAKRTAMLTLTVRHGLGDNLRFLRKQVAEAWRRFVAGKGWISIRQRVGLVGFVRAMEVTHGRNGWHPHLHVLLLVDDMVALESGLPILADRWRTVVEQALGVDYVPDAKHGVDLTTCASGSYLSKLGLELTNPGEKQARNGNRTPLEIAADLAAHGRPQDAALFRGFVEGMHGAKQLTWSRGLKGSSGVEDVSDDQIIEGEEQLGHDVFMIERETWKKLAGRPGARLEILRAAEAGGEPAVQLAIRSILGASPPD